MGILIAIVLGGLVGWLASKVMNTEEQGVLANVLVGVIGAFVGNLLVAPILGHEANITGGNSSTGDLLLSLLVAFVGACILLAVLNLVRGRKVR